MEQKHKTVYVDKSNIQCLPKFSHESNHVPQLHQCSKAGQMKDTQLQIGRKRKVSNNDN